MQGQRESNLTEHGRAQAVQNAATVAALGVDAIYASPLRRTRQSAKALADRTGLPIAFDDRLKEWDAGEWSGYLYEEVIEKWPEDWAAWRADMWNYRPPGCENFEDLARRGGAFLKDIQTTEADKIAIVSHGFIGRAMMAALAGLTPEDALRLKTANDIVFRFRQTPNGWRADRFERNEGPLDGLFESAEPSRLA